MPCSRGNRGQYRRPVSAEWEGGEVFPSQCAGAWQEGGARLSIAGHIVLRFWFPLQAAVSEWEGVGAGRDWSKASKQVW